MKITIQKCMVPDCDAEKVVARGLCNNHYSQARFLIASGHTTWDKLVKNKKALPTGRKREAGRSWFLS